MNFRANREHVQTHHTSSLGIQNRELTELALLESNPRWQLLLFVSLLHGYFFCSTLCRSHHALQLAFEMFHL